MFLSVPGRQSQDLDLPFAEVQEVHASSSVASFQAAPLAPGCSFLDGTKPKPSYGGGFHFAESMIRTGHSMLLPGTCLGLAVTRIKQQLIS
jgi:hypothetical protein